MNQRILIFSMLSLLWPMGFAFAGDLEDILAKHYAARGGLEELLNIKAMQVSGQIDHRTSQIAFTYTIQGERCRLDAQLRGKKLIRVYDGQKGWQVNPLICSEPQPLTRHETRKMRVMADDLQGPLVDWEAKGHRLSYAGTKVIDGKPLHKIVVDKSRGNQEIVFLDSDTFLEKLFVRKKHGSGPPQFSWVQGYETLDGIVFVKEYITCPDIECCLESEKEHNACRSFKRVRYQIVKVNPTIDDRFFAMESHKTVIIKKQ